MNTELRAGCRPNEVTVQPIRIYSVNYPKRHINQRQQNLKLHAGACSEGRICARQECYRLLNELSLIVQNLTRQLVLFQNPSVPQIEKWRKRQDVAD